MLPDAEILDWGPTLGGALHFVQLPAMVVARRVLDWDGELGRLSPMNRQIIKVIGGGIVVCVLGLAILLIVLHGRVLKSPTGVALCLFLSVFWAYRGAAQLFVYRRLWPAGQRWAHIASLLLFASLAGIYGLSALFSQAVPRPSVCLEQAVTEASSPRALDDP